MSSEDDWDVEQHKTEHECDEHWELRRKFLLAHKDKFPEDELVCLAQVFTNVELLGCRYPKETMQLIAELARDIVEDYRERQKKKLQRTFVKASDAASSKVKGIPKNCEFYGLTATTSTNKTKAQIKNARSPSNFKDNKVSTKRIKLRDTPFGDMVLVERPDDTPQNIIACAVNASGGNIEWKIDRTGESCKCSIFINSKPLTEACSSNRKQAKKEASIVGLRELQKHYYTIKIKHNIKTDAKITTTLLKSATTDESISDDNIGKKLMKLMGWAGGGLGKSQQGIVEPVTIKQQISRDGLGLKSNSGTVNDLRMKSREVMRKFLASDMSNDLIFSSDFSNDERATIHQIARQLGLKSHSYGPKTKRTLVISRKIDVRDLVEELRNLGGVTNKYKLIEPTENLN
ncbi:NF-kappa-B-repressing factor isoform X1 [Hylaeus volcanicus]|uniref:NF-kappa-B-repressing factor isoform X1 n=1 Tax=Hylaeus volcanicus TaxID=313075 RepID=UPI0023B7AF16|nr:NF-kappa-B-repressing factor isoform X1 [Hylaeus volcanicus]